MIRLGDFDNDRGTCTHPTGESSLSYDDLMKAKKFIESIPKPELNFNEIWCSEYGEKVLAEKLGAIAIDQDSIMPMLSGRGPRIIVKKLFPDNVAWLILSNKSPFELPKIVAVIDLSEE